MKKRSYQQACGLALALDLIGERWTWLIVRALLTGAKRYGQLLEQLPGMGTNLLAERLRSLTEQGIVEKEGPGAHSAYRLSEQGEALRPITHELIRWGSRFLDGAGDDARRMPEWDMLAIEAFLNSVKSPETPVRIGMSLSGHEFQLHISPGGSRAISGAAAAPDTQVTCDTETLQALAQERLDPQSAEHAGRLEVTGRRRGFDELIAMLSRAGKKAAMTG